MMKRKKPEIIELDMKQVEELLQRAKAKLSEEDYELINAMIESYVYLTDAVIDKKATIARLRKLLFGASTEKTDSVIGNGPDSETPSSGDNTEGTELAEETDAAAQSDSQARPPGHGRNGVDAYPGAENIEVPHGSLEAGDSCPECGQGTVYQMTRPGVLIRFVGRAPVHATVYRLQKLRCNLCGKIFTAPAPEGVNKPREYDVTVGSIIALLKYGSGLPFNRLAGLQWNFGIPLPASTQWDIVHKAAKPLSPILKELIRQAALGDIVYNDDTTVRILDWMGLRAKQKAFKEDTDEIVLNKDGSQRCGMYTTGIVSTCENWRIALFFSGRRHAGENLMKVLGQRSDALPPPIQMCDPLPHNMPDELQTILGNCLAHGRRQFVDVVDNFPKEVEHVLRALKEVYKNDATARKGNMSPEARLRFHQAESGPIMKDLREWMTRQIDQRLVEPNSGLGEAISYMTKRWDKFTLFLREAGAPLDNNICERALKKAILHRKNSYFYKTLNGAHVGDLFMSLIYTCELCKVNAFDYLTELLRHADQLAANPERWMPWNYRQAIKEVTESAVVVG
jgi:transposase